MHFNTLQGWEILDCELLEKDWKERIGDWNKQNRGLVVLSSSGPVREVIRSNLELSCTLFLALHLTNLPQTFFLSFFVFKGVYMSVSDVLRMGCMGWYDLSRLQGGHQGLHWHAVYTTGVHEG